MKCSVCGSENLEGSAYCEDCGARLPVGVGAAAGGESGGYTPAPTPVAAPTPPPPPPLPTPAVEPPAPAVEPAASFPTAEEPAVAGGGTVACAACGAENPAYEAYCEDCGASLTAARAGGGLAAPPLPTPPPVVDVAPPPVAPPVAARHRLVLADGAQEFPMNKDEITLGRRSPADGIFPDVDLTDVDVESYISRRHGRIVNQDGRFLYEDIGSSNGSFVNGTKLQPNVQAELHDGDRLRLGKTEMIYRAS